MVLVAEEETLAGLGEGEARVLEGLLWVVWVWLLGKDGEGVREWERVGTLEGMLEGMLEGILEGRLEGMICGADVGQEQVAPQPA